MIGSFNFYYYMVVSEEKVHVNLKVSVKTGHNLVEKDHRSLSGSIKIYQLIG